MPSLQGENDVHQCFCLLFLKWSAEVLSDVCDGGNCSVFRARMTEKRQLKDHTAVVITLGVISVKTSPHWPAVESFCLFSLHGARLNHRQGKGNLFYSSFRHYACGSMTKNGIFCVHKCTKGKHKFVLNLHNADTFCDGVKLHSCSHARL